MCYKQLIAAWMPRFVAFVVVLINNREEYELAMKNILLGVLVT